MNSRLSNSVPPRVALRAARLRTGLNQMQFAKLLGVARLTVVEIEQGTRHPSFEVMRKWAKMLGVSMDLFNSAEQPAVGTLADEREAPETLISKDALWLWSVLDRMERRNLFDGDPIELAATITPLMRDEVLRLASRAAALFSGLGEERKQAAE